MRRWRVLLRCRRELATQDNNVMNCTVDCLIWSSLLRSRSLVDVAAWRSYFLHSWCTILPTMYWPCEDQCPGSSWVKSVRILVILNPTGYMFHIFRFWIHSFEVYSIDSSKWSVDFLKSSTSTSYFSNSCPLMPWSHQTFRLVLAMKLLGIMLRNRWWPTIFFHYYSRRCR